MSVRKGFLASQPNFGVGQDNAPSSSAGSSIESAYDPNTGVQIPGYKLPQEPPRLSTDGALGDETAHGDVQAYKETRDAVSGGVHCGGSPGIAIPTDIDRFSTKGTTFADSTGVAGGPYADHDLVVRKGGADDQTDTGASGGRVLL
jgi:hypothetical protein